MSHPVDAGRAAVGLVLAWRSGRLAMDASPLRDAVARVLANDPAGADFGALAVLESAIRGIVSELEAAGAGPAAGPGAARGAVLSEEQVRACGAALAAGLPEEVLCGRSRPPLRADLQRLLSRLARQSTPRNDFARLALELDACLRPGASERLPPRPAPRGAPRGFDLRSFRRHRFGRLA